MRSEPYPLGHYVGRFARPAQRAAPQCGEVMGACPLCQIGCLLATRVVERDRQVTLEAALEVIGGLAVSGQVDASRAQVAAGSAGSGPGLRRYRNEYRPAAIAPPSRGPTYQTQPLAQ